MFHRLLIAYQMGDYTTGLSESHQWRGGLYHWAIGVPSVERRIIPLGYRSPISGEEDYTTGLSESHQWRGGLYHWAIGVPSVERRIIPLDYRSPVSVERIIPLGYRSPVSGEEDYTTGLSGYTSVERRIIPLGYRGPVSGEEDYTTGLSESCEWRGGLYHWAIGVP